MDYCWLDVYNVTAVLVPKSKKIDTVSIVLVKVWIPTLITFTQFRYLEVNAMWIWQIWRVWVASRFSDVVSVDWWGNWLQHSIYMHQVIHRNSSNWGSLHALKKHGNGNLCIQNLDQSSTWGNRVTLIPYISSLEKDQCIETWRELRLKWTLNTEKYFPILIVNTHVQLLLHVVMSYSDKLEMESGWSPDIWCPHCSPLSSHLESLSLASCSPKCAAILKYKSLLSIQLQIDFLKIMHHLTLVERTDTNFEFLRDRRMKDVGEKKKNLHSKRKRGRIK